MGGGVSVQHVIQDQDKDLWRRVISVDEHDKYQNTYLTNRNNKTKLESYKATKAELLNNWNNDYSEAALKVIERWGKCIVNKILLVRTFQTSSCYDSSNGSSSSSSSSRYSSSRSSSSNKNYNQFYEKSMTADNCDRLARSMKRDQLFTTSLWFQLDERLWVSVEKKDVVHMKTMPSKYLHECFYFLEAA